MNFFIGNSNNREASESPEWLFGTPPSSPNSIPAQNPPSLANHIRKHFPHQDDRDKLSRVRTVLKKASKQTVDLMRRSVAMLIRRRINTKPHDDATATTSDENSGSTADPGSVRSQQQPLLPRLRSHRGQRVARIRHAGGRDEVHVLHVPRYTEETDGEEEEEDTEIEDEGEELNSFIAALTCVDNVEELERAIAEIPNLSN